MQIKSVETHWVKIYIAGDYDKARDICRQYCYDVGMCVNVIKNDYIYTGGEEQGVIVEVINYPRFPSTPDELFEKSYNLALELREQLYQDSVSLVTPEKTLWLTLRD